SAAAELAVPVREDVTEKARAQVTQMRYLLEHRISQARRELAWRRQGVSEQAVRARLQKAGFETAQVKRQWALLMNVLSKNTRMRYNEMKAALTGLDPLRAFERGYSITLKDGRAVKSVSEIAAGDALTIRFVDGSAKVVAEKITPGG
ncbi:MAG TPA: hypothetical protein DEB31_05235, partial [Clostridiales bacterium]|nr:hypothetical protein [Clostridiales bacterium]